MVKQYKLRKITTKSHSGDTYGITIPAEIAEQFPETKFSIIALADKIIFTSGALPVPYGVKMKERVN